MNSTHTSRRSNLSHPSKDSIEYQMARQSFRNTSDRLWQKKLDESIIPDIADNDPSFYKVNLKTINTASKLLEEERDPLREKIEFPRLEQNLTVRGNGDNLKVEKESNLKV